MTWCHDYQCAKSKIEDQNTVLVAGAYIILVGTKDSEGVVITRDETHAIDET